MTNNEFICHDCESEFNIDYEGVDPPVYCPFCAARLKYDDTDLDEDWYDDGC